MSEPAPLPWLLLAFQLPAQPAYLRVKIWRRLQSVGAISFRNALYVLPASESAVEDFEWILREVREAGGAGALFESRLVEDAGDDAIRALFDAAREEDYHALAEELRGVTEGLERRRARTTAAELGPELARIRRRLAEIEAIDFFNANGRESVHALLRKLDAHLPAARAEETAMKTQAQPDLRGRTWVTRAHVQVDRMASAWLIRRRIDPEARFKFVADRHYRPAAGEVRFDMYEGEYTHDAERCTFEVLLDLLSEPDEALRAIAEIVHDLDLKDRKYEREEAPGVKQLLAGIVARSERDEERLERSTALFDDLYRSFLRPSGTSRRAD
jgi:hypothetical protein